MNKAEAKQHGVRRGKESARTVMSELDFSNREEAESAIRQAETASRQFSPFETFASEINSVEPEWRRDSLWGMYDIGVTVGIEEILNGADFDSHDCRKNAVQQSSDSGTYYVCSECRKFLSASAIGEVRT